MYSCSGVFMCVIASGEKRYCFSSIGVALCNIGFPFGGNGTSLTFWGVGGAYKKNYYLLPLRFVAKKKRALLALGPCSGVVLITKFPL